MNFSTIYTYQDLVNKVTKYSKHFRIYQQNGWFSIKYLTVPDDMKQDKNLQELRGIKFFGNHKEQKPSECKIMSRLLHKFYNIEELNHDYKTYPVSKSEMYLKYDGYLLQFYLFHNNTPVTSDNITNYSIDELDLVPLTKSAYQNYMVKDEHIKICRDKINNRKCSNVNITDNVNINKDNIDDNVNKHKDNANKIDINKDNYIEHILPKKVYNYIKCITYNSICNNKTWIYEFVAPFTRYNNTSTPQIILLAIRHNHSGVYYKIPDINFNNILFTANKITADMKDIKNWADNEGVVCIWHNNKCNTTNDISYNINIDYNNVDNTNKLGHKTNKNAIEQNNFDNSILDSNTIYQIDNVVKIKSYEHMEFAKFDITNIPRMYKIIMNNELDDYTNKISKNDYNRLLKMKDDIDNKIRKHVEYLNEIYDSHKDINDVRRNVCGFDKGVVSYRYKNDCTMYEALISIIESKSKTKAMIKMIMNWS